MDLKQVTLPPQASPQFPLRNVGEIHFLFRDVKGVKGANICDPFKHAQLLRTVPGK